MILVFGIGGRQPLELRNMAFRNNDQPLPFGNQIMVRKNHGSTLISVVKRLSFHAGQARDLDFHALGIVGILADDFQLPLQSLKS